MKPRSTKLWVIVPAAGSGRRMASEIPKQYLKIGGQTVLEHSIQLLAQANGLEKIVLCTAADDHLWSNLDLPVQQAVGGATRAQSVLNGLISLQEVAADQDWVIVHDAARPCLTPSALNEFIDQLLSDEVGGLLAMPCKDTLKLENNTTDGRPTVSKTLNRDAVWQAQTPQMFRYGLLVGALHHAIEIGADITDEASAMELAGFAPRLIVGDASNIKITTPEDLKLAQFLLSA